MPLGQINVFIQRIGKYSEKNELVVISVLAQLEPMMIYNGGNILMVQMENEYGSYGCDFDYTTFLRDQALTHLGSRAVLYTTGTYTQSAYMITKIIKILMCPQYLSGLFRASH